MPHYTPNQGEYEVTFFDRLRMSEGRTRMSEGRTRVSEERTRMGGRERIKGGDCHQWDFQV
jgi:hypothetical protein